MEITFDSVRNIFFDVLEGRVTREEADRWAYSIVKASEEGELIFFPQENKKQIWEAVMFLYGIDSMDSPGEYLHTEEEIRCMLQKIQSKEIQS